VTDTTEIASIDKTLRWIVLMFRLMGWIWCVALVIVTINRYPAVDQGILVATGVIATVFTGVTVLAIRRRPSILASPWFVVTDGLVVLFLIASAWMAGASDFVSGGYPASWVFVVAYATTLRVTMAATLGLTAYYAVMHVLLDVASLEVRTIGSIQFVVYGLLAGWTFDTLRFRENLRIEAERKLAIEQQEAVRHEERANLARRLHDSVLQTLHVIKTNADDPSEVRYLARRQERELRRTIDEFESRYEHSFRVDLLRVRNDVEDLFRVEIEAVIRDDAELNPALAAIVSAAHEAMANAAKHSGAEKLHLYSEIANGSAVVNIHDRGRGFGAHASTDRQSLTDSMMGRVVAVGGKVVIESVAGRGMDVSLTVPHHP